MFVQSFENIETVLCFVNDVKKTHQEHKCFQDVTDIGEDKTLFQNDSNVNGFFWKHFPLLLLSHNQDAHVISIHEMAEKKKNNNKLFTYNYNNLIDIEYYCTLLQLQ